MLFAFSLLLEKLGITPVCRKCTALAILIKMVNLSDHFRAFSAPLSETSLMHKFGNEPMCIVKKVQR